MIGNNCSLCWDVKDYFNTKTRYFKFKLNLSLEN